jgi:hypothetical protein
MRPEGLYQRKIPIKPLGIKPTTFRFVAQCLNQLRHRVPRLQRNNLMNSMFNCQDLAQYNILPLYYTFLHDTVLIQIILTQPSSSQGRCISTFILFNFMSTKSALI